MISEDWRTYKLKELFSEPSRNGLTKPSRIRGEGIKMVNMGELFAHDRIRNINMDRVPLTEKEKHNFLLQLGDLLFARQSLVISGAGKCSIFLEDDEAVTFESHIIRTRYNQRLVNPQFLYYFFKSHIGKEKIKSIVEVTAAAGIRGSDLAELAITIPGDISSQNIVVEILSSIDDKIELNLQMNKSLEGMAQSIFKEWFVDFRFPGFDGELIDGLPKGWSEKKIGSLFDYDVGGDWGQEEQSDDYQVKTAIIRGTDFKNVMNGDNSRVPIRYIKRSNIEKKKAIHGDILLEISGGSPDQPTGRTMLCTEPILKMFDCPVAPASFCRLIRPLNFNHSIFLSTFMSYFYDRGGTWEYQNQSTGISNFQFRYFSENKLIAVPEDGSLINDFGSKLIPIFERHSHNIFQTSILTNLRDTILPKLMTGKIRVS